MSQLADAQVCPLRYRLLHELGLEERPGPPRAAALVPLEDAEGQALAPDLLAAEERLSSSERGTAVHRLLERLPLDASLGPAELRAALTLALTEAGHPAEELEDLVEAATAFLTSPLGSRVRAAGPEGLHRELPFRLALAAEGSDPGPELVVHGQLDALLLEPGAATVIDYKFAQKRPVDRYAAQLSAYALAAHELAGGRLVHTGLVFLRSKGAFVEGPAGGAAENARTRETLLGAARAIATGRRTGEWAKAPVERCEAIECGFVRRCHPRRG